MDEASVALEGELTNELPPNVHVLPGGKDPAEREREAEEGAEKARQKRELVELRLRAKQEKEEGGGGDQAPTEQGQTTVVERFALTCLGNADRPAHYFGDRLRYVEPWRRWIWHDGTRWRLDETNRIGYFAEQTVYKGWEEARLIQNPVEGLLVVQHFEKSEGVSAINGMIKLARHKLAVEPTALVAAAQRLVTASGIVDLQTGALVDAGEANYDLHWTPVPYDPGAPCPKWRRFVSEVMGDDQEMVDLLQRVAGYATTGHSSEQVLLIFLGSGGNGKGTFLRTISRALGDYAIAANVDFLHARRFHGHPTDIDQLRHKRLVVVGELAKGDGLDEAAESVHAARLKSWPGVCSRMPDCRFLPRRARTRNVLFSAPYVVTTEGEEQCRSSVTSSGNALGDYLASAE